MFQHLRICRHFDRIIVDISVRAIKMVQIVRVMPGDRSPVSLRVLVRTTHTQHCNSACHQKIRRLPRNACLLHNDLSFLFSAVEIRARKRGSFSKPEKFGVSRTAAAGYPAATACSSFWRAFFCSLDSMYTIAE